MLVLWILFLSCHTVVELEEEEMVLMALLMMEFIPGNIFMDMSLIFSERYDKYISEHCLNIKACNIKTHQDSSQLLLVWFVLHISGYLLLSC